MSWQKFQPSKLPWRNSGDGEERVIATGPSVLKQRRANAGKALGSDANGGLLLIPTSGALALTDGTELQTGDLMWIPAGAGYAGLCHDSLTLYELHLPASLGPSEPRLMVQSEFDWQSFDDPAGRPTQPVQVLMEGELSILRTRFVPEFTAGDHWHDFDTWYFITGGSMRFGDEGIYSAGDVRQVTGGYSYGPEEPGPVGVEFVLVSVGGPVALHWADLEEPPHGPLQAG